MEWQRRTVEERRGGGRANENVSRQEVTGHVNDPQRFTWHQLLATILSPFRLVLHRSRSYLLPLRRLTTSPSLTVPGITGGAWGEIYPEGGSLARCFQREVAPRQSRATTTLSTIWHKSTRCSTLGEIRPPLSPYCLPSPPFFLSRRVPGGGRGTGPLSGPICRLLIQLAFPPFASAP